MNKFEVKILPREVILDTQGRAIEQTLKLQNQAVSSCRVGRFIVLEVEGDEKLALEKANQICKSVLHNPLIETYEIKKV